MNALRTTSAVVVGYLLFAVASMLLVGQVMSRQGPTIMVLGLAALAIIGVVAGVVASAIAPENRRLASYTLAGLVAVATIANLAMQLGAEPIWYKVGTLVLTVPAIVLMGLRRPRPSEADGSSS